jgi:hypothetical protein
MGLSSAGNALAGTGGIPRMNIQGLWLRSRIWLRSWIFAPSPDFDSATIAATTWALDYAPKGDEDVYSLIAEFAEHQYTQTVANYDSLDRKADELIRLTTTISGAILTAAASKFVAFHHAWLAYLALAPTALSVFTAIRARTPGGAAIPITARDLLAVADLDMKPTSHQIESVIAASLHVTILGMRTITTWKGIQIRRATTAFLVAFILLLLALI